MLTYRNLGRFIDAFARLLRTWRCGVTRLVPRVLTVRLPGASGDLLLLELVPRLVVATFRRAFLRAP